MALVQKERMKSQRLAEPTIFAAGTRLCKATHGHKSRKAFDWMCLLTV